MENTDKKKKGVLPIFTAIVIAGGTIIASAFGAWATASTKVNAIDTKIQVVEERENNHYLEISKKLDYIINKLD